MPPYPDPTAWYEANAAQLAPLYEGLAPTTVHGWLQDLLPKPPAVVIDIGAGTGRDAAWLASAGHEVLAIEPATSMRAEGARLHGNARIRWLNDRLPSLAATLHLGIAADVILLSGVWQHVPPGDRPRAFRKLVSLLKSGGLLAFALRHGPAEPERGVHPVTAEEIERLARDHGMTVAQVRTAPDHLGRQDISWTCVALRLPDDGTGALPLLRHVILHDDKSSTYKLGLLRALCRAADSAAGLTRDAGDEHVALPMGLIALNWLRLYLPLVTANLPQSVGNVRAAERLGFAKDGFRVLMGGAASALDLRIGARFGTEAGRAIHAALREAARTIADMPARFVTHPNGGLVLPVQRGRAVASPESLVLDAEYLWSFGEMRVPRDLWRALQRHAAWVEPSLIAEWTRLMRDYAERQGRCLDEGQIGAAMTWSDPARDVRRPREIALSLMKRQRALHCVWSGRRLEAATLDIDHCFPWAAWPCGDLWNLLPAHRRVNQHQKRDRLPSEDLLRRARGAILEWWNSAYLSTADLGLARRFGVEALASLPALHGPEEMSRSGGIPDPEDVYAAMGLQRLRLRQDQQVPEWTG